MKALIASDIHGSAYWMRRLMRVIEDEQPDRIILLGDLLYHGPRNELPREYDPRAVLSLLNVLSRTGGLVAVRGNCDAEVDQMVLEFPCMADYAELVDDRGRTLFMTHGHKYGVGLHGSIGKLPSLPDRAAVLYGHTHIKVNQPIMLTDGIAHRNVSEGTEQNLVALFDMGSNIRRSNVAQCGAVDNERTARCETAISDEAFGYGRSSTIKRAEGCDDELYSASDGKALHIWAFNPGSVSLPKDGTHSCGIYDSAAPIDQAFRHVEL